MVRNDFFLVFILAHLIGDFVLQTNKIAVMKASGKKGLLIHSLIVLTSQVIILSIFGIKGVVAGVLCGVIHFFLDYIKYILNKYFKNFQVVYFIIDQILHILLILLITILFAAGSNTLDEQILLIIRLLISLIIVSYVSSVTIKMLLRDLYYSIRSDIFFKKSERLFDALSGIMLWFIWFFPAMGSIIFNIVAFYFYQKYQKSLFKYDIKVLLTKYVILSLIGFLVFISIIGFNHINY